MLLAPSRTLPPPRTIDSSTLPVKAIGSPGSLIVPRVSGIPWVPVSGMLSSFVPVVPPLPASSRPLPQVSQTLPPPPQPVGAGVDQSYERGLPSLDLLPFPTPLFPYTLSPSLFLLSRMSLSISPFHHTHTLSPHVSCMSLYCLDGSFFHFILDSITPPSFSFQISIIGCPKPSEGQCGNDKGKPRKVIQLERPVHQQLRSKVPQCN